MPVSAPKVCTKAGCNDLAYKGSRCEKHPQERTNWAQYQNGKTSTQRGYGAKWRVIRANILVRDNYLCQPCKRKGAITAANIVDHIKAKAHGGTDDPSNLEATCDPCHKAKTARERL